VEIEPQKPIENSKSIERLRRKAAGLKLQAMAAGLPKMNFKIALKDYFGICQDSPYLCYIYNKLNNKK